MPALAASLPGQAALYVGRRSPAERSVKTAVDIFSAIFYFLSICATYFIHQTRLFYSANLYRSQ
jgi:hypothetical protein